MSSSSGGTSSIPAGEAAADEPSTSSDVQQDATTPFVRLSKAEKRARRAELAVETRRLWRLRQKELQHAAVASRAEARAAKLAAMDETERAAFEAADRADRWLAANAGAAASVVSGWNRQNRAAGRARAATPLGTTK